MTRSFSLDNLIHTAPDWAVRDRHLARIREAMQQAGLPALLVVGRDCFRYFADYHRWSREALVLITPDSKPGVSVSGPTARTQQANLNHFSSFMLQVIHRVSPKADPAFAWLIRRERGSDPPT
jgi:hypothetical protein